MKKLFDPGSSDPTEVSRSRLERFIECPRCFYFDLRKGIKRPSMPGFTLNMAVDALLKKEFDVCRNDGNPHPLMRAYGLKAVPFQHPEMDVWRNNFKGVRYLHEPTNFIVYGAIDDVWQGDDGKLIVVDYKATSTTKVISLDDKYRQSYKRQMEIYQWLMRRRGFEVSDTGYFVYANGSKDREAFDGRLEFRVELIPYQGDDSWVEGTIKAAHDCLMAEESPKSGAECEYCQHHRKLSEAEKEEQQSKKTLL